MTRDLRRVVAGVLAVPVTTLCCESTWAQAAVPPVPAPPGPPPALWFVYAVIIVKLVGA